MEWFKTSSFSLTDDFLIGQPFRPGCIEEVTVFFAVFFHFQTLFFRKTGPDTVFSIKCFHLYSSLWYN